MAHSCRPKQPKKAGRAAVVASKVRNQVTKGRRVSGRAEAGQEHAVVSFLILGAGEISAGGLAGKGDAGAGEPAAEPGGAVGVVGEEEVVDRVLLAAGGAGLVRIGPGAHAGLVGAGAGLPVGLGEDGGRGRYGADCGH